MVQNTNSHLKYKFSGMYVGHSGIPSFFWSFKSAALLFWGKTTLRGYHKEPDNVETCKEDSPSFPEFHCAEVTTKNVAGDIVQTTLDAPSVRWPALWNRPARSACSVAASPVFPGCLLVAGKFQQHGTTPPLAHSVWVSTCGYLHRRISNGHAVFVFAACPWAARVIRTSDHSQGPHTSEGLSQVCVLFSRWETWWFPTSSSELLGCVFLSEREMEGNVLASLT